MSGLRVDVCGMRVSFGRKHVLRDVTLSVLPGECVAVLGCSGCGKSTFLKAVVGRCPMSQGLVLFSRHTAVAATPTSRGAAPAGVVPAGVASGSGTVALPAGAASSAPVGGAMSVTSAGNTVNLGPVGSTASSAPVAGATSAAPVGAIPTTNVADPSIGFVPQDDLVHLGLTVEAELSYAARIRASADRGRTSESEIGSRVDAVIGQIGLDDCRRLRIGKLSGGQRKRVSIGLELLGNPGLLVLDEPTSGLDIALENQFMGLFSDLARAGRTVILSTHILQSLSKIDLVCVFAAGRIAWYGPPREMLGWFGVSEARDIYELTLREGDSWAERYEKSPQHYLYVEKRMQGIV